MKPSFVKIFNTSLLVIGVGLLVLLIVRLDVAEVGRMLVQVGWYFALALVVALSGIFISTGTWRLLIDPRESRASYFQYTTAYWAGYAINQLTPASSLGDVLRCTILKDLVSVEELVTSMIAVNFLNKFVIALFNMLGPTLCLLFLDIPAVVVWSLFGIAAVFFVPIGLMYALLRWGIASKLVAFSSRLPFVRFRHPDVVMAKALSVDNRLLNLRRGRPRRFWAAVALVLVARLPAVGEVFVLLVALMPDRGLGEIVLISLLTQTMSQLVIWAATLVPGQIGIAEGGSALLFQLIGLNPLVGLAMELTRRIRKLLLIGIGLLIGLAARSRRSRQQKFDESKTGLS